MVRVRLRVRVPGLGLGCLDVEGGHATTVMAMLTSADMKSKEERAHTLASSAASHGTPSHAAMRATLRGRSSARSSKKSHKTLASSRRSHHPRMWSQIWPECDAPG